MQPTSSQARPDPDLGTGSPPGRFSAGPLAQVVVVSVLLGGGMILQFPE